jgi:hypothetical protein
MAATSLSNTFNLDGTSYYYHFDNGTGAPKGKYLASSYHAYATFWGFTSAAVGGKNITSCKISIEPDTYTVSGSKTITFFAACAPLNDVSDPIRGIILRKNRSNFNAYTSPVTLARSGATTLDVTNVVKYAADNYTGNWGFYVIGTRYTDVTNGDNIGSASKITFKNPKVPTLEAGPSTFINIGGTWKEATPYIKVNGVWQKATGNIKINSTWQ